MFAVVLLFADDQSLIHNSGERLQEHVELLDSSCEKYSMSISIEKTEVMCIGRELRNLTTEIKGKRLK